jgi:hypothetical protein
MKTDKIAKSVGVPTHWCNVIRKTNFHPTHYRYCQVALEAELLVTNCMNQSPS